MIGLVIIIVLGIAVAISGIVAENRAWNNGACSCGNGFWIFFDIDSQGGHGYKCSDPKCRQTTWQSWRILVK